MRIVFAGTPDAAIPSLRALVAAGHDVVAVVSREDAPTGRKRILTPSPIASVAEELGLNVIRANKLTPDVTAQIATLQPEVGVIVAYGGLVPQALLAVPTHGWFNLHFSLLPEWRGAAPVQRSLMAGDAQNGITIFQLVQALDAGDILSQRVIPVDESATAGDVLAHYAEEGARDIVRDLESLASDNARLRPQTGEGTYAQKLTNADGRLDWTQPASRVFAQYRGVTPEPGAFTEVDGQRVKVLELARVVGVNASEASAIETTSATPAPQTPGRITLEGSAVLIGTADAPLRLVTVQPAGKRAMAATDWFRGLQLSESTAS